MHRNAMLLKVAIVSVCLFAAASCKSEKGPPPIVRVDDPGNLPAPAVTQASWAPDALEELVAPIALYPDQLLVQILAASINSQEVLDGGNWLLQNQNLTGNDLDAAAQKVGFGPAMRALLQFPTIVDMMCKEIDWTRQLGSAFSSDQKSVLDAVQRLRKDAAAVGNLKSTPQQTVSTKTESGNMYIEVKPADPKIVYVPQYDPQVVYTTTPEQAAAAASASAAAASASAAAASASAAAAASASAAAAPATSTTTVIKEKEGVSTETAIAAGLIGFMAGAVVGAAVNDNYYYPSWGVGVYYGPRPFYPPAYAYRPVYGAGFRPAYGYATPYGYRNSYNNVRVNNVNINNNNNYYNRFNNNQNLRNGAQSPRASQLPADQARRGAQNPRASQLPADQARRGAQNPRASQLPADQARGDRGNNANWKGQPNYAGSRDGAGGSRSGQTAGETRPENNTAADRRADPSRVDRGYGDSTRPGSGQSNIAQSRPNQPSNIGSGQSNIAQSRPNQPSNIGSGQSNIAQSQPNQPSNIGSGQSNIAQSRPSQPSNINSGSNVAQSRPSQPSTNRTSTQRESAFSGSQMSSGNFDRAASARGNASVGSRQTSGGRARRR
jgi:hypothetical protein